MCFSGKYNASITEQHTGMDSGNFSFEVSELLEVLVCSTFNTLLRLDLQSGQKYSVFSPVHCMSGRILHEPKSGTRHNIPSFHHPCDAKFSCICHSIALTAIAFHSAYKVTALILASFSLKSWMEDDYHNYHNMLLLI